MGAETYRVIVSDRAEELFIQHVRFVAQVSEEAAEALRVTLIDAVRSLSNMPERGSFMNDSALPKRKYRKRLVGERYLLLYQIKGDTVFVDYVLDCRQDYRWLI